MQCTSPEGTTKVHDGPCKKERECSYEWKPVCGDDNEIYPNSCFAESKGILNYTKGICKKKYPKKLMKCSPNWKPVCGSDNKTYPNKCVAKKSGISIF